MIYMQFPVPVTIDESCLVVHRDVRGTHEDSRTCWCCPAVLTQDELARLTIDDFNALTRNGVQ